jgi:hypothetical protein
MIIAGTTGSFSAGAWTVGALMIAIAIGIIAYIARMETKK